MATLAGTFGCLGGFDFAACRFVLRLLQPNGTPFRECEGCLPALPLGIGCLSCLPRTFPLLFLFWQHRFLRSDGHSRSVEFAPAPFLALAGDLERCV